MTTSERLTHEYQGTSGTKPAFEEVIEDLPAVQLADQLRALEEALKHPNNGKVVVEAADLKAVIDLIREQDNRVCWFTTCKSCSKLWDKVYEYDIERQWRTTGLTYFLEQAEKAIAWRRAKMPPTEDLSIFAHSQLSTAIKVARDAKLYLGDPLDGRA